MADDIVIRAKGLGKKYMMGHAAERERNITLRDTLVRGVHNFWRKTAGMARGRAIFAGDSVEEFWALKDVSFEVKRGEVLGIIGRNGAGKSTLLKILSRITEPTEGRVTIKGQVASLLEVGTGFHSELTGRENIYLNGAILGMTRAEISRKFDEIVAFAEIEQFLDTPVKRYSSGMYVRLAFAVAAHLDPEILILDEVLAVGDTEFQRKCLGKVDEVSRRGGRTVLFVSHNLGAIAGLADRAILLASGSVAVNGSVAETVSMYLSKGAREAIYVRPSHHGCNPPNIARVEVLTSESNGVHRFGEPLEVKIWIKHLKPIVRGCLSFHIINELHGAVVNAVASHPDLVFGISSGFSMLVCRFPAPRLNVGLFYLRVFLAELPSGELYETLDGICAFEVVKADTTGLWGWRPEACAYHEDYNWSVTNTPSSVEGNLSQSVASTDFL
jgi:lipopolysaccharide transport system ATP-binding protein